MVLDLAIIQCVCFLCLVIACDLFLSVVAVVIACSLVQWLCFNSLFSALVFPLSAGALEAYDWSLLIGCAVTAFIVSFYWYILL